MPKLGFDAKVFIAIVKRVGSSSYAACTADYVLQVPAQRIPRQNTHWQCMFIYYLRFQSKTIPSINVTHPPRLRDRDSPAVGRHSLTNICNIQSSTMTNDKVTLTGKTMNNCPLLVSSQLPGLPLHTESKGVIATRYPTNQFRPSRLQ